MKYKLIILYSFFCQICYAQSDPKKGRSDTTDSWLPSIVSSSSYDRVIDGDVIEKEKIIDSITNFAYINNYIISRKTEQKLNLYSDLYYKDFRTTIQQIKYLNEIYNKLIEKDLILPVIDSSAQI